MEKLNFKKMAVLFSIIFLIIYIQALIKTQNKSFVDAEITEKPVGEKFKQGGGTIIETAPGRVTLNFKNADLNDVLRLISYKSGINIVVSKEVTGTITISLKDVAWEKALKAILKVSNFGYEREGNIITVEPVDRLTERSRKQSELAEVQPVITEIFRLKFLDASDAKKAIQPQLSSRGKVTVVTMKGQRGWEFGTSGTGGEGAGALGRRERVEEKVEARSKVLLVSDIPSYIDKVRDILSKIDVMPRQVLIEARIIEVNRDKLEDIGFDWGTGSSGAESTTITGVALEKERGSATQEIGGKVLGSQNEPSVFGPKTTGISGTYPYDTGLSILYKKLTGAEFEVLLHALAEDVEANTLSAPRIMTLDNQEATILVGTKYPILQANVSGTESTTTTTTLDYYQDVGIQLNVVPQICNDRYINMIVHPAVTSYTTTLQAKSSGGYTVAEYPIILTRETETQILVKDGETVVIGGLLKDVESKGKTKVPLLGDIPLIGLLFQRKTTDTEKIDLLIFLTARIIEKPALTEKELSTFNKYKK